MIYRVSDSLLKEQLSALQHHIRQLTDLNGKIHFYRTPITFFMFDKSKLVERIRIIEGLSADEQSALSELLNNQKKYGLVWEEKPEEVEQQLQDQLPVLTEVVEKRIYASTEEEKSLQ